VSAQAPPAQPTWIFGYGSLIWKVDFPVLSRRPASILGWGRRFWQGSHDHRGLPHAPGRVVTLIPEPESCCHGMAYEVEPEVFEHLDFREKNGYERHGVTIQFEAGHTTPGLVYIAPRNNHAFLGPADVEEMAQQILHSCGPSGSNREYLLQLVEALKDLGVQDAHVSELHDALLQLEQRLAQKDPPPGSADPSPAIPCTPPAD